eukprot:jgi/Bigna1/134549/aug1.25_g9257
MMEIQTPPQKATGRTFHHHENSSRRTPVSPSHKIKTKIRLTDVLKEVTRDPEPLKSRQADKIDETTGLMTLALIESAGEESTPRKLKFKTKQSKADKKYDHIFFRKIMPVTSRATRK